VENVEVESATWTLNFVVSFSAVFYVFELFVYIFCSCLFIDNSEFIFVILCNCWRDRKTRKIVTVYNFRNVIYLP
jgi:hypothetical protein